MNKEKIELGKEMDKAFHYLAKNLEETGHNSKPVLFHSFRVANRLYELNYSNDIVIASILHDILEDTDVTYDCLTLSYGKRIADIVKSGSFNPEINDHLEQARILFENCINYGIESVIIKCSDLIENIDYVKFVEDSDKRNILLKKYMLFLDMTKDILKDNKLYEILKDKVNENMEF